MKRTKSVRDFDFYIDEYMYNCQSWKLRKKTLQTYEQTLRFLNAGVWMRWELLAQKIFGKPHSDDISVTCKKGASTHSILSRMPPLAIRQTSAEIMGIPSVLQPLTTTCTTDMKTPK